MPIPTEAIKAIYKGPNYSRAGLELKPGDKGKVRPMPQSLKQFFDVKEAYQFYPNKWKGYCVHCSNTDFTLLNT